jgi:predicted ATPase
MAILKKITLTSFKGAGSVTIDLGTRLDCPVTTLIGLNESGKTTILEGLSHFISGDTDVSSLFEVPRSNENLTTLIPIHRKAAFTGEIQIQAEVIIDDADLQALKVAASNTGYALDVDGFPRTCTVTRVYVFEDSVWKATKNQWNLNFKATTIRKTAATVIRTKDFKGPTVKDPEVWKSVASMLSSRLPRISYFPTFLVGLPKRIYLKTYKEESAVNRYYRTVLQDVLDSLGEGLSLEKHVCKRIEDFAKTNETPQWFGAFLSSSIKAPIDSVVQKIGNAVTREVLGSWKNVFQLPISAKNVQLEWQIDAEKENLPYVSFYVSDGESRYEISERSLGFRWFFSFLLFTAFKRGKGRSTLMLFDEPAANLHAKAQAELLKSFAKIVKDGNRIVYSTHSHHMIDPKWLSGAYIVENTAIDYDNDDTFNLGTEPTNVKATPYRQFVSNYPNRTSYFQPVIEKLGYVTPAIIGTSPYVIVEGISDYYALKLVNDSSTGFSILPGVGAGSSGPIISLLLGRGEQFLMLFDDDKQGRLEAERYKEQWLLPQTSLHTLKSVSNRYDGFKLENLFCDNTRDKIKMWLGVTTEPTKKQIGLYLAESFAVGAGTAAFGPKSIQDLKLVLDHLRVSFSQQAEEEPTARVNHG